MQITFEAVYVGSIEKTFELEPHEVEEIESAETDEERNKIILDIITEAAWYYRSDADEWDIESVYGFIRED